jgi:hypothetical protein
MSDIDSDFDYNKITHDEYLNDELTYEEVELLEQYEKIKHFTLDDYMECKETRTLLLNEWEEHFNENLKNKIMEIFDEHYHSLNQELSNVFFRADENHSIDLVSLVRFHLKKNYSTNIFKENPHLAEPMLSK